MNTSSDRTLAQAVTKMTSEATQAGCKRLILSKQEWTDLVEKYMLGEDNGGFAQDILNRAGSLKDLAQVNRWIGLATVIWNATPQPDRGGKISQ